MKNYSDFSPVVKFGIPYKRGTSKYYDWLAEQEHYIKNGYEVGGKKITGRYYFFLNFFKLLHTDESAAVQYEETISPYLADVKKELYDLIDECEISGHDIVVPKCRDKGLSYDFASIALRETHFYYKNSICAIFPGGESKAMVKFKEKYDEAWNLLLDDFKHYPDLTDNKQYYKYGRRVMTPEGNEKEIGIKSSFALLKAVDENVAKSGRYKIIFVDEAGEIPILTRLITTNYGNMRKGKFKYGMSIVAGTTNALNKGYTAMRNLVYNAKDYGYVAFPITAQRAYWGFVNYETGESDTVGAEGHIKEERARLEKRTDYEGKRDFIIHKQNYPLSLKEMFTATNSSPYDQDLIAERLDKINSDPTIKNRVKRGNLVENSQAPNGVEWKESRDGRWQIFLHPADNPLKPDVGAIDSYRFSNAPQSDSLGAIVVYRPWQGVNKPGDFPVCIYHHRPKDKESFFRDCLLTSKYYNIKMLIEKTDEDIFKYFMSNGGLSHLKRKPKIITSPFAKETYTYGVDPSPHNIAMAAEYSVNKFSSNYHDIVFSDLLDELSKFDFGETNTDIAYAYHWAILHAMDDIKIVPQESKEKKISTTPYAVSDGKGGFRIVRPTAKQQPPSLRT